MQTLEEHVGDMPELRLVGKALFLISGGIDSPVAAWLLIRKGVTPIFTYFDNYPLCDQAAEDIALECVRKVCAHAQVRSARVYVVPHSPDLKDIVTKCPMKFACILSRRMMFRIAEELAIKEGCRAIVTGDSIGQKASQTLQNIASTDCVLRTVPVLRPLVGMNKLDIERYAKQIQTYPISIRPGVASCGVPTNNPSTAARRTQLITIEAALNIDEMAQRATASARLITIK